MAGSKLGQSPSRGRGRGKRADRAFPADNGILFVDDGCEHSPRCLDCPLEVCKYDIPPSKSVRDVDVKRARTRELLESGLTVQLTATEVGFTERTVWKIKKELRESAEQESTNAGQ